LVWSNLPGIVTGIDVLLMMIVATKVEGLRPREWADFPGSI